MHPALSVFLRPFDDAVSADPEVLGALYTGSLGRGTADRFSDLDLQVWVEDSVYAAAPAKLHQLLGYCGDPQFAYMRGAGFLTGFVGPEWRRVDIELSRASDLEPDPKYADAHIVKDTGGFLERLSAASLKEPITADADEIESALAGAVDSQIYLTLHNARGAVWSAMGEVSYQVTNFYTLLAKLRGHNSFGFRYVEALLSPEEAERLTRAWPQRPERAEVRRAARELWNWVRHVRSEAERILGRPLNLDVDERQMQAAIDRIYTWAEPDGSIPS